MDTEASRPRPPEKWLKILDRLDQDVTDMLHVRQIWDRFVDAVQHSDVHEQEPVFASWVSQLYAHTQAIAIRRMVDKDEKSASFFELLRRMAGNPDELELAPSWWPGNQAMDPSEVRADSDRLLELAARVDAYATKNVAHADLKPLEDLPTFKDVSLIIDEIERLLKKYILFLTGGNRAIGPPIIQTRWDRVFYEAWLPCPDARQPQNED